jgi:hypothetical protein
MLLATRSREPEESVALLPSDRWTLEIGTAHAGYPVSKLKTDNTGDTVRAYGQRQSHTRIQAITDIAGVDRVIDYVALVGINREMPRSPSVTDIDYLPNRARLIIDDATFDTQEPPIVSGNFFLTNLVGSYSTLNQPINPPEETVVGYTPTSLTATNPALNTEVTAEFDYYGFYKPLRISPDPNNDPLHKFLVHVKNSNGAGTLPNIEVTLRQGSSGIRLLSQESVEITAEGFIFTFPWDAGELPDPSLPVRIKIVGISNGSMVPVPISVLWRAEVSNLLYESVPLEFDGALSPIFWQSNPDADIVNGNMLVWHPNITIPAGSSYRVLIELSDFSATSVVVLPGPDAVLAYSPLGPAFTAGRFAAGEALNLPLLEVGGANFRKTGNNQGGLISSYGGHLRAARTDQTRWEATFHAIPQSQTRVFGELDRLFRDVGFILPTLYIPDTSDLATSLWATLTSWEIPDLGAMSGEDYPGAGLTTEQRYDLTIGVLETGAHNTKIDG